MSRPKRLLLDNNPHPVKAHFCPFYNLNSAPPQFNFNQTSIQLYLKININHNPNSTSTSTQPPFNLSLNLNFISTLT